MNRKIVSLMGVGLLCLMFHSCTTHPEKGLLDRYFNALSLNDLQTLSTMAIEPAEIDFKSWKIVTVSEVETEPFKLPELDQRINELKKKVDGSVDETLTARDALDEAKFELERRRTRANRQKVDELQAKYDELYEQTKQLQKEYNQAKEQAQRAEEIALFSLGGDYPAIRQFTGDINKKHVDISVTTAEGNEQMYRVYMRQYELTDPTTNLTHNGRWIIVRFEKLE